MGYLIGISKPLNGMNEVDFAAFFIAGREIITIFKRILLQVFATFEILLFLKYTSTSWSFEAGVAKYCDLLVETRQKTWTNLISSKQKLYY